MVYQDLALAGNMPIYENIYLGREPDPAVRPSPSSTMQPEPRAGEQHLDRLKIHVKSVDQNVEELSGGQRQAVAIARATAFDARLVIMDEPTAALAIKEVGKVLDLIKDLKEHGVSVILISHRMDDIFYVLRPGDGALPWPQFRRGAAGQTRPQRGDRLDHGHQGAHDAAASASPS